MKKRILIVGGNSKIARVFIGKYCNKYKIDITLHKNKKVLDTVSQLRWYKLDLTNELSINNLINFLKNCKYDGVLFFSSVYYQHLNFNSEDFGKSLKTNILGNLKLIRGLKLKKNSKIIFFTDEGLEQPKKNHLFYSFSKALLKDYIRLLAVEFSLTSIVLGIGLGPTITDKVGFEKKKYFSRSLVHIKNPSLGLANLINFILSEDNFYSTGKIIPFDGGTYLKRQS